MKLFFIIFFNCVLFIKLLGTNKIIMNDLDMLPGEINTYYVNAYKDKAEYLKILVEDAVSFYENFLNDSLSFDLFVLDRKNWKHYAKVPYPIAHYVDEEKRMILPVCNYFKIELPGGDSVYGNDFYYLSDFIAIHELGHYISHKQGALSHSKWSGEFFADFILIAYLYEVIPGFEFDNRSAVYFKYLPLKYKSLEKFNSAGIINELAYHPKFQELANQIYLKHGLSFINHWIKLYQHINNEIREGKYDSLTFTKEEIFQFSINDIQSIEPEIFNEWKKSMQQTYHPLIIFIVLAILIVTFRLLDNSNTIFISNGIKTNRKSRIFGVSPLRIWFGLKSVKSLRLRYRLILNSILYILNFFLALIFIVLIIMLML